MTSWEDLEDRIKDNAIIMLASVRAALTNGCKHYSNGRLLTTEKDILICLMQKKSVEIDESERVERVKVEDVIKSIRKHLKEKLI